MAAKRLADLHGMDITFKTIAAENIAYPLRTFDVITACQCFFYFDHSKVVNVFADMLKDSGHLLVLYMAWLPFEDPIAKASEDLVLKYNPTWSGCNEVRKKIVIPEVMNNRFTLVWDKLFDVDVSFTRESWHGRIKACRGMN